MIARNLKIAECLVGNAFRDDELFRNLPPATVNFLKVIRERKLFTNDTDVYLCDEPSRRVYILREGEAVLTDRNGRPLRSVAEGEIIGLTEAVTNEPYAMGCRTVTPCMFESVRRDDFVTFLQHEPEISFRLLRMLGFNLQKVLRILAAI